MKSSAWCALTSAPRVATGCSRKTRSCACAGIIKLQNLGLSLSDIQALVRGQNDAASAKFAAIRLQEVYLAKLVETRSKLTELKALESELEASLEFLSTCHSVCESEVSSIHSCPTCAHHAEQPNPPELVAGSRVN